VLHRTPYTRAEILVSGDNFGCGSSREHAPWALLDFGIRCVIAPSFADIFYNNCFKNGILPVTLPEAQVHTLMRAAEEGRKIGVDLPAQTVTAGEERCSFEVDAFRKHCLLNGLDDIGLSLQHVAAIDAFERAQRRAAPWLYAA
jgi:3-isopropylmalate/(R)-2-methylmalate dehydratase small subunit